MIPCTGSDASPGLGRKQAPPVPVWWKAGLGGIPAPAPRSLRNISSHRTKSVQTAWRQTQDGKHTPCPRPVPGICWASPGLILLSANHCARSSHRELDPPLGRSTCSTLPADPGCPPEHVGPGLAATAGRDGPFQPAWGRGLTDEETKGNASATSPLSLRPRHRLVPVSVLKPPTQGCVPWGATSPHTPLQHLTQRLARTDRSAQTSCCMKSHHPA